MRPLTRQYLFVAPVTRAKSTELSDNLKKSVARLSTARTPQTEAGDKGKVKQGISGNKLVGCTHLYIICVVL